MNAFADSLLSMLLSWVKGAARAVFDFFVSDSSANFYTWLGDHWLLLAAILCAGGLIVDYAVWMIRYKPFARAERRKKTRDRFDREQFLNGYDDRVDVPLEGEGVSRAERFFAEAEGPDGQTPRQEEGPSVFTPENGHPAADPAPVPELEAYPVFREPERTAEGTVRRRRADRYRALQAEREYSESVLPGENRQEPGTADPGEKYFEPVYPRGDASEWQKWNKDPS